MNVDTRTSQIDEVVTSSDMKEGINKIADDSILDSARKACGKLPANYTINGWNIVGNVD